jgi:hypothetical protein
MNVIVPGQAEDNPSLTWFFSSLSFGEYADCSFGGTGMFCHVECGYVEEKRTCIGTVRTAFACIYCLSMLW